MVHGVHVGRWRHGRHQQRRQHRPVRGRVIHGPQKRDGGARDGRAGPVRVQQRQRPATRQGKVAAQARRVDVYSSESVPAGERAHGE